MKFALFTVLSLCLIAACRSAEEEYDYEEEAAPAAAPVTPTKPAAGRLGGLLSPRGRGNAARKAAAAPSTTAKPVEQPVEEEIEDEEQLEEVQEQEEVPTTTTESSKKVRGGVRPFRSNEDLLAALKRRRAQVGPGSHSRESSATQTTAEPTTPRSKATTSSRGKTANGNEARTSNRGRFGATRGSKQPQEEVEESQREEIQVKPKPYRRG